MRERAQTVIIGAGIVGVSAAYHLTDLGVTDVLVLDQGPLFETGGSTSHAPGIIFQTNGSRTMCRLAQDSVALYDSVDLDGERCWYGVGGLEVATTPERMEELKRRQGYARSYGIEGTELLTPAEAAEKSPLLDPATILGAYWIPSDGAGKAVKIVTKLGREAQARGVDVRGRRDRHRVRHPRRAGARGRDRSRHGRVRARADLRGVLGTDGRRDGGRADPARRGAAPARVDRPDPRARRARRRHLGAAAGRAPPGHVPVLPAARRPLRRRQLPARADRDAAALDPAPRRRPDAVADAVDPRRLRPVRGRDRAACSRRSPAGCARATPRGR